LPSGGCTLPDVAGGSMYGVIPSPMKLDRHTSPSLHNQKRLVPIAIGMSRRGRWH